MDPAYVSLLISGLTASIALHKVGEMKANETVLITGNLFYINFIKTTYFHKF